MLAEQYKPMSPLSLLFVSSEQERWAGYDKLADDELLTAMQRYPSDRIILAKFLFKRHSREAIRCQKELLERWLVIDGGLEGFIEASDSRFNTEEWFNLLARACEYPYSTLRHKVLCCGVILQLHESFSLELCHLNKRLLAHCDELGDTSVTSTRRDLAGKGEDDDIRGRESQAKERVLKLFQEEVLKLTETQLMRLIDKFYTEATRLFTDETIYKCHRVLVSRMSIQQRQQVLDKLISQIGRMHLVEGKNGFKPIICILEQGGGDYNLDGLMSELCLQLIAVQDNNKFDKWLELLAATLLVVKDDQFPLLVGKILKTLSTTLYRSSVAHRCAIYKMILPRLSVGRLRTNPLVSDIISLWVNEFSEETDAKDILYMSDLLIAVVSHKHWGHIVRRKLNSINHDGMNKAAQLKKDCSSYIDGYSLGLDLAKCKVGEVPRFRMLF